MMMEYFNFPIGLSTYLDVYVKLYVILNLLGLRNIIRNKKLYIATAIVGTYAFLSYVITDSFIRLILLFILIIFATRFIVKDIDIPMQKIIILVFICWTCLVLIDIFVFIIGSAVFRNDIEANKNIMFKNVLANFIVILLYVLTLSNKYVHKFCINISDLKFNKRTKYMVGIIALSVLLFSVLFYFCYFNINRILMLVIVFITVIIYTVIVFGIIKEYEKNLKIQSEYDILLKNLNEYENLLDLQRVTNHENKNQLLVIKGMVDKGESNTSEYINSIIDTQYKDNDAIIYKTNRIPSGGLRGLIYYKILTMKEKKINSNLDVDRSLNELDFDNIPIKTNQELCKIVGVFLDNAIQAVSELKKKEIDIYLKYENDELYIKVSNNYSGIIELDKIDNSGYTTKGKGHGYGLSLVKGIIRENDCFKNDREIHGKMFSQIIRLKINED